MSCCIGFVFKQADSNGKRLKVVGSRGENGDSREVEASSDNSNKMAEQDAQPSEAPKQDYIHVRARRGQATDSHSLAERVSVTVSGLSFCYSFHGFVFSIPNNDYWYN